LSDNFTTKYGHTFEYATHVRRLSDIRVENMVKRFLS